MSSEDDGFGDAGVGAQQVDVWFLGLDGLVEQQPWLAAAVELEPTRLEPVRAFAVRRGKRLAPGWWWAATIRRLVPYGSAAMRDALMLLDFDPHITELAGLPLEFVWRRGRRVVAHAPQLAARTTGGEKILLDCPGPGGASRRLAERARVVAGCAQAAGWRYRIEPAADPVLAANVRWLSGYRHPRFAGPVDPGRLRDAFAAPRALGEGAAALGEPIATLPAVYHGLWARQLTADLGQPLTVQAAVSAAGGDAR